MPSISPPVADHRSSAGGGVHGEFGESFRAAADGIRRGEEVSRGPRGEKLVEIRGSVES